MTILLLTAALVLQCIAAVLTIRLMRIAHGRLAWLLLSAALILGVVHHGGPLLQAATLDSGTNTYLQEWPEVLIALCMVGSLATLGSQLKVVRESKVIDYLSAAMPGASVAQLAYLRSVNQRLEREIAVRKTVEGELRLARESAEAANAAKSAFLANTSHEIRTPMTAILGFTDILVEDPETPEAREAAQTIRRNGQHLLQLINDILDLSKIESGNFTLQRAACSPCQIVTDVVSLMRIRAEAAGLPLAVECGGPMPETILTDPLRMRQILLNLVGNAIKFTETGGVRLVGRLVADAPEGPKVQFDVIDTGIGMPEELIGRLFQPFTQGDHSTNRRFGGTGLGLAISRRLARMLGGDIEVTSRPSQGSLFRLTLAAGPLEGVRIVSCPHKEQGCQLGGPLPRAEPRALECRVLLVEDGLDNQRLISFLLRRAGAEVVLAWNGEEALEQVFGSEDAPGEEPGNCHQPFDVILMDMQMPVMDGYEATRRLRGQGYAGPVIALTAHAMSQDRQRCLEAGCDDYLVKPVDRTALLELVAKYARLGCGLPDGASAGASIPLTDWQVCREQ